MKVAFLSAALLLTLVLAASCTDAAKDQAYRLTGGDPDRGKLAVERYGCAACHTIPGIPGADALVGPPLTRMGARVYIGGVIKNTPENMMTWLKNPPAVDPLTAMPNLHLQPDDARDIAGFLYTLR